MSCPDVVRVKVPSGPAAVRVKVPSGPAAVRVVTLGPPGPPGPAGDSATVYVFTTASPTATWTINHNLGFKPSVELFSSGSQEIDGDVVHTSSNQTVVSFNVAISGFARLN